MCISIRLFGVELRTMDLIGHSVCFSYCRRIFYLCLTIFIALVTGYERVAKIPRFKFVEANLTYVQGEMAVLKCAVENLGTKSVAWRKLPYITPILVGERRFAADERYSANHVPYRDEWNLWIRNAQTSDTGIYECQVSSKHRTLRQNISLLIIERRFKKAINITGARYVERGMPLLLVCNATGEDFPPDEIQWFFDGEKLQSDSRKRLRITDEVNLITHTLKSTLEIMYASMSDTGNYVCRSSARLTTGVRVEVLNGWTMFRTETGNIPPRKRGTFNQTTRVENTVQQGVHDVAVILRSTTGTILCLIVLQYIIKSWQLRL
ncbi:zwei Ig domain protein zig-8-like isoform X2 [Mizuhopecten yessoensis]|uniref:zwei Ig domain protein zig-8-like isoform X2 n=1 Tax=Mizuhopecten yessoensis TaxID=6573 RepID=UPI000B45C228|nr:zwei Ig domain protein zig-8-like isoform X2 [Mizuhopecten yessoensis]